MGTISGTINRSCKMIVLDTDHNKVTSQDFTIGGDGYTKLLLHMDEEVIKDSSVNRRIINKYGFIARSATQSKFGGYSCYFDGTNDYLSVAQSSDFDFGSGSYTVDFWVNFSSLPTNGVSRTFFNHRQGTTGGQAANDLTMDFTNAAGNYYWRIYLYSGGSSIFNLGALDNSVTTGTWYHIAFVRSGNTHYIFKNGILLTSNSYSVTYPVITDITTIGFNRDSGELGETYMHGYFDEYRVSKGIARWTSNFTTATGPYKTETSLVSGEDYRYGMYNINVPSGTVIAFTEEGELYGHYNISYIKEMSECSGGTVTYYGDYKIHSFTSSGTFVVPVSGTVDILIVGAGGGPGGGIWYEACQAGGGGGRVLEYFSYSLSPGSYTVTIGQGGASAGPTDNPPNNNAGAGGTTYFGELSAAGGGGAYGTGHGGNSASGYAGAAGGGAQYIGGGGGGNAGAATSSINGGIGSTSSIRTGSSVYYGGGGRGSRSSSCDIYGSNGSGGGMSNFGGGGASNSDSRGGHGIVVVRYVLV